MFNKILIEIVRLKYGLLIFIIILSVISFLTGAWWSNNNSTVVSRVPLESLQEKQWQKQGQLFNDGIFFIPSEMEPGIYRTTGANTNLLAGCRWQRLSGFEGGNDNVIVNYVDALGMPTIVEIKEEDAGFYTEGCGKWYASSVPVTTSKIEFGDGAYIVNHDIEPGTYKSNVQYGCIWERLSGVTRDEYKGRLFGKDTELIASSRKTVVTIKPDDKAFISSGCGDWVKQDLNNKNIL